ncbi:hypothetical protein D3C84_928740 [compost metagenome]
MIAAGDLQAAALLEGVAAGGYGGPDRAQGAFNQPRRPGKAESADGAVIQGAGKGRRYIVGVVDPGYLLAARGGSLCQRIALCCQDLVGRLVLGQGKAVALGQRQGGVMGVIEDAQGHGNRPERI